VIFDTQRFDVTYSRPVGTSTAAPDHSAPPRDPMNKFGRPSVNASKKP
jgi:hypothetical protein